MIDKKIEIDNKLREEFKSVIKGNNFMTPYVLEYRKVKNNIIEISTGDSFLGVTMYGITVVTDGERNIDLDCCKQSLTKVEDYINDIKLGII